MVLANRYGFAVVYRSVQRLIFRFSVKIITQDHTAFNHSETRAKRQKQNTAIESRTETEDGSDRDRGIHNNGCSQKEGKTQREDQKQRQGTKTFKKKMKA